MELSTSASQGVTDQASFDDDWNVGLAAEDTQEPSTAPQDSSSSLLPQLHPAVTLGMQRVSSCYFSIQGGSSEASASVADLLSLLGDEDTQQLQEQDDHHSSSVEHQWNPSDVLYHDIMMGVFTFLDANDLRSFSQVARKPNFECFYYLQLQLQQALVGGSLQALAGSASVARLAQLDNAAAKQIVQQYLDSNSTLRVMPLSHSLAFLRHLLSRHGFQQHVTNGSSPPKALASAALLITLVGAASFIGSGSTPESMASVLRVGLAGSLMGAAATKTMHQQLHEQKEEGTQVDDDNNNMTMRETAEQMAHMMQEIPSRMLQQLHAMQQQESNDEHESGSIRSFPSSIATRIYSAFSSNEQQVGSSSSNRPLRRRRGKHSRVKLDEVVEEEEKKEEEVFDEQMLHEIAMEHPLLTPSPNDHLEEEAKQEIMASTDCKKEQRQEQCQRLLLSEKMPSGCVGAYLQAVKSATDKISEIIKQERQANFSALSMGEQLQVSRAFLEACSSDDSIDIVQDMVQVRKIIDVDGFYVGADGNETCALHTAAFHGAYRVLEFLCKGINKESGDGGLANVNLVDSNGWTGLHFAAGANSVEAVRILAARGAELAVEAGNGYTPFHWAQRLSNQDVANELERLGADQRFQPLSAIAGRFFAMIPSPAS